MGFTYDTSMAANGADATWPYTLDNGVITECGGQTSLCGKKLDAAGLWEVPMYTSSGPDGIHLMDPANDFDITSPVSPQQAGADLLSTFNTHNAGNKAPFGLYVHPVWLGAAQPGIPNGTDKLAAMNKFLDLALATPDTWMVTVSQLVEYVKNPVSAADLASQPYMQCTAKPAANICNGASTTGIQTCPLSNGLFQVSEPTHPDVLQLSNYRSNALQSSAESNGPAMCGTRYMRFYILGPGGVCMSVYGNGGGCSFMCGL